MEAASMEGARQRALARLSRVIATVSDFQRDPYYELYEARPPQHVADSITHLIAERERLERQAFQQSLPLGESSEHRGSRA